MPVITALGKLRQEAHQKFKAYLGHRVRPCFTETKREK